MQNHSSPWRRLVAAGYAASPALTVLGFIMAADLVFCLLGLVVDHRVITGAPAWLKPAKFALSTMIAAWSFAFLIASTTVWPLVGRGLDWVLAAGLFIEIALIDMQAARGTSSHFNVGSHFDAAVFAVMGVTIACIWLAMMLLTVVLFRQTFVHSAWGWSLRLGMFLALIGTGSGGLMAVPNSQQLANAHATGRLPIAGAHTVGAPDGGRGLPVTGWSVDHGDLRIAHFLGMHGLQVLPLLAWWIARRRAFASERTQRNLIFAAATSYLALFGLVLWQAFRGQSIAQPRWFNVGELCCVVGGNSGCRRRDQQQAGRSYFQYQGRHFMTADALFRLCNSVAMAGWLLLVVTGWSPRASRIVSSLITGLLVPALLCSFYLVLILTHWSGHKGGFNSLSAVMLLFTDHWLVLAGWVHYLAFDLFIGSWQVRDATRNRVPFLVVLPCLLLTFLFGPIGLLLYLLLAGLISRGKAWPGHPAVVT